MEKIKNHPPQKNTSQKYPLPQKEISRYWKMQPHLK